VTAGLGCASRPRVWRRIRATGTRDLCRLIPPPKHDCFVCASSSIPRLGGQISLGPWCWPKSKRSPSCPCVNIGALECAASSALSSCASTPPHRPSRHRGGLRPNSKLEIGDRCRPAMVTAPLPWPSGYLNGCASNSDSGPWSLAQHSPQTFQRTVRETATSKRWSLPLLLDRRGDWTLQIRALDAARNASRWQTVTITRR